MRDTDIARHFIKATTNILATMAGITAVPGTPFAKKNLVACGDVSAIIGVTGARRGTIAVSFTSECAAALVTAMLGDAVENLEQDMQDAVGEIANMVSGQARASIAAAGLTLHGATPSVITGENHHIRHMTSAVVIAIPFATEAGRFTVEFCLEQSTGGAI